MASSICRRSSARTCSGCPPAQSGSVRPVQQAGGGLAEHSYRVAGLVADDVPSRRIRCRGGDPGQLHCLRIRVGGVSAGVCEKHGVIGRHAGEGPVQGKALDIGRRTRHPLFLVPPPSQYPLTGGRFLRCGAHQGDDLVPGLRTHKLQLHFCLADAPQMGVAFDEAGNGKTAVQVDHTGRGAHVGLDVVLAPDCRDSISAYRDGLSDGAPLVDGRDAPVAQHQVGRFGRAGAPQRTDDGQPANEQRRDEVDCRHRSLRRCGPRRLDTARGLCLIRGLMVEPARARARRDRVGPAPDAGRNRSIQSCFAAARRNS